MSLRVEAFLNLQETDHHRLFEGVEYPWQVLGKFTGYLQTHLKPAMQGRLVGQSFIGERVYIGPGTIIEPGACILGPAWIGSDCVIRPGAYLREQVIVGNNCVLGNSCEFKNCLLFNHVQVPHFSYVGDSILGHQVHLGAGVILSNLKLDKSLIQVRHDGQVWETGLKKFGAIVGDMCEIGTHCVINPGSLLGKNSFLYPGAIWKGVLAPNSIVKSSIEYKILPKRSTA